MTQTPEQPNPSDRDAPGLLSIGGRTLELPRTFATEGSDALGIGKLLGSTGMVTLDAGFTNTASCTSDITYIDGAAGILRYRGYPIEELAKSSTFLEVTRRLQGLSRPGGRADGGRGEDPPASRGRVLGGAGATWGRPRSRDHRDG